MLSLSIQYLLPEMGMFIKLLLLVCINNYLRHSEYIFTTLRNYLNFPKTKKKDFLFFWTILKHLAILHIQHVRVFREQRYRLFSTSRKLEKIRKTVLMSIVLKMISVHDMSNPQKFVANGSTCIALLIH